MTIYISPETAKRLKEFLGNKAPEPMVRGWYLPKSHDITELRAPCFNHPPAYQLHDLLSKPFCEAMAKRSPKWKIAQGLSGWLFAEYYIGGLPAVEKALIEMMEAK